MRSTVRRRSEGDLGERRSSATSMQGLRVSTACRYRRVRPRRGEGRRSCYCVDCDGGYALGSGASPGTPRPQVAERTRDQIRSLQEEKLSRTPAQRNRLSAPLRAAAKSKSQALARVQNLRPALEVGQDGRVLVDITARIGPELIALINRKGGLVVSSFRARLAPCPQRPLEALEALAENAAVRSVAPAARLPPTQDSGR
jgi:hypothetical protein